MAYHRPADLARSAAKLIANRKGMRSDAFRRENEIHTPRGNRVAGHGAVLRGLLVLCERYTTHCLDRL